MSAAQSLYQAVKDETIDPLEMKTIMAHLGRLLASLGTWLARLHFDLGQGCASGGPKSAKGQMHLISCEEVRRSLSQVLPS